MSAPPARKQTPREKWPKTITVGSSSVKIYREEHATYARGTRYIVAWYTAAGRQTQKFATAEAAIIEARLKAGKLAAGHVDAANMSNADRDELHAAREITPHVLSSLREWKRIHELTGGQGIAAAESWAQQNRRRLVPIKVPNAVERFIAAKNRAGKQGDRTYRAKLEPLARYFPERNLDSITGAEFDAYLEQYSDGVTRNDFRKRAVALCRWGRKHGHLAALAQLEIEKTERAPEKPAKIGTITPDTFRRILEFLRQNHIKYLAGVVTAGFAALRADEIQGKRHDREKRQSWDDIDLAAGHLNVTAAKENTPAWRLVTLCDAAVEWLLTCPDRHGPICEAGGMEKVRLILRHAGFDLPENCFRHSAISYRIAVTGDKAGTAVWAGNSEQEIDRRYRRPMSKAAGETWYSIRPTVQAEVVPIKSA